MMVFMYLLVIILFYIVELLSRKRIKGFLPTITLIFLICLMGANTENPDTIVYENIYNRETFFTKDIGFGLIVWMFKTLEIPYEYLKFAISVVGIVLIDKTIKKFVKDTKLYYLLYFIYPFVFDVVQVRNFLAMSIFICAVPYLLENTKKSNFKYVLLVLLAASIQKVALVYLPIIFIKNINFQKRKNLFLNIIIVVSIVIGICKPLLYDFIEFLREYLADNLTGLGKQLNIITNWGWIIDWFVQFFNFILVKFVRDKVNILDELDKKENEKQIRLINCIYIINYYMFIFLPLYVITPTFNRIMRNILPLNFLCFNMFLESKCKKNLKYNFVLVTMFYILFVFCVYTLYKVPYFITVVKPIFTKNWIFNF